MIGYIYACFLVPQTAPSSSLTIHGVCRPQSLLESIIRTNSLLTHLRAQVNFIRPKTPRCLPSLAEKGGNWDKSCPIIFMCVPCLRPEASAYLRIVADHVCPSMTTVDPSPDGYLQHHNAPCHNGDLQQLLHAIMSTWTQISEDCFQHLLESLPRRTKAILKAKRGFNHLLAGFTP